MKTKSILQGMALLLTLGGATSALAADFIADTITFDPDGTAVTNSDTEVRSLDWFLGSTLVEGFGGGITSIADGDVVTGTVQTYTHESLATLGVSTPEPGDPDAITPIAPDGLGTAFELTFISGFSENVSTEFTIVDTGQVETGGAFDGSDASILAVNASSTFTFNSGGENFFEIYYDDLTDGSGIKSSGLSGLGYNDGTQILSGTVADISGGNFDVTYAAGTNPGLFQFMDYNKDGKFDPADGDTIVAVSYATLDSSGTDNWSIAGTLTYLTVEGGGRTTVLVDVDTTDPNFFKDDVTQLAQDSNFTTENEVPFVNQNPSLCFDSASGKIMNSDATSAVGNDATLAAQLTAEGCTTPTYDLGNAADGIIINGVEGPDLLLMTDASQSFKKTQAVPEPGILALLGLGLGLLGATRSRRS